MISREGHGITLSHVKFQSQITHLVSKVIKLTLKEITVIKEVLILKNILISEITKNWQ